MAKHSRKRTYRKRRHTRKTRKHTRTRKTRRHTRTRKTRRHTRKTRRHTRKYSRRHTKRHAKSINSRIKHSKSKCARYNQKNCGSIDPNCQWRKKTGCVRSRGKRNARVYQGPLQA